AAARRRISFSISRRRFSRRSRTTSSCSAVVTPCLMPSSMSAWRIQRRTDSGATSKSAATSLIVRSPRRATVTTSRLNSGGNFLGIATSFPPDHVGRKRCQPNPRQTHPVEGSIYIIVCTNADGVVVYQAVITYQPGTTVIDAATLARQAYKELPLLYPDPHTAPPSDQQQLVGVRTWMWLDPAQWQPRSATAAIPGLSATVTAQPSEVRWDMGDGTIVTCNGPGTPYDPSRADGDQHSDCTHVFEHDGTKQVRATIVWRVTWQGSDGSGGTLPTVERSTQFPLHVAQRQAVINK